MKVTMHEETPSEQLVKQALAEITVPTKDGRRLTLRKPGFLAQFKLVQVVGGEAALNPAYMNMIAPVLYLSAIDGDLVTPPTTTRELDALIQRLDEDGYRALAEGVQENFGQKDAKADEAALKN